MLEVCVQQGWGRGAGVDEDQVPLTLNRLLGLKSPWNLLSDHQQTCADRQARIQGS